MDIFFNMEGYGYDAKVNTKIKCDYCKKSSRTFFRLNVKAGNILVCDECVLKILDKTLSRQKPRNAK